MSTRHPAAHLAAALIVTVASGGYAAASDVEAMRERFREVDSNGDRALQFTEIETARARLFDRLDSNGNAVLDPEEVEALRKAAAARQGGGLAQADLAGRARLIDADGDGVIERAEFARFLPERLRKADANGDRKLSLRELRALKRDREAANLKPAR